MSMLGASLDHLAGVAGQMSQTAQKASATAQDNLAASEQLAQEVQDVLQMVVTRVQAAEADLQQLSGQCDQLAADGGSWTGGNQARYAGMSSEIRAGIDSLVAQSTETLSMTKTNLAAITSAYSGFMSQYKAVMDGQVSPNLENMRVMAESQSNVLDSAMNSGIA